MGQFENEFYSPEMKSKLITFHHLSFFKRLLLQAITSGLLWNATRIEDDGRCLGGAR